MKSLAYTVSVSLAIAGTLAAQETSRFTADIGGGFTTPVGATSRQLDNPGWNIEGGVGYNFSPHFGAKLQLDFNDLGVNSATLSSLGVPNGSVHVFSATIDPIIHLNPKGHIDPYIIGGGGLYHWYQQFTQPTVATSLAYDPFFGFYPAAFPVNQVVGSYSVNKPGMNIGAGIAFGTKFHGKFFAEARWDRIFMTNFHADYVPVTFGFRW